MCCVFLYRRWNRIDTTDRYLILHGKIDAEIDGECLLRTVELKMCLLLFFFLLEVESH